MSEKRKSYIPDIKTKTNIIWPLVTMISFLILLILLILLVFGYLDSIYNIVNRGQITSDIEKSKVAYESATNDVNVLNENLIDLKEQIANLNATEGTKLEFYNEMKKISNIRETFGQRLYNSINTRNILTNNTDKIFISEYNNLAFLNSYLYDDGKVIIKPQTNNMFKYLSKEILSLLKIEDYEKYVKNIVIESHINEGFINDATVVANARAISFKNALLDANSELKELYSKKIVTVNMFDSKNINTENVDGLKNNRIEINIIIDDNLIFDGITRFINQTQTQNVK